MMNKYFKINLDYSKSVMKNYAKSFYLAATFLPKDKRFATYAVYTFCRYTDNLIDNPRLRSESELLREMDDFKNELELSYKYGESEHPALASFAYFAKIYQIPIKYPLELIEGVIMDLTIKRYNTFEELSIFCYRVASTVGLMMIHILGFKGDDTLEYAEKLGVAMQLTNILRDVKEDKNLNRIYLPLDELKSRNISEEDIIKEKFNDSFRDYMIYNIERAKSIYIDAETGIKNLDKESRFAITASSIIYKEILAKISEQNFNPFLGRASISILRKFSILMKEILKSKF